MVVQENEWKQLISQLDPDDRNSIRYDDLLKWLDKAKDEGDGGSKGRGRKDEEGSDDERGGKGKASSSYEGKRKGGLRADEAVEITVGMLKFTDRQLAKELKGADVSVSYRFLEDKAHQSGSEVSPAEGPALC